MNATYLSSLFFLVVSSLGALYLLAESVLQAFGKSICATAGCKVVAQYSRFGDLSFVLGGLAAMTLLAVLAAFELRRESPARARLMNAVLVAALAAEGFLAGYQLFWLHAVCVFCISVLCIFIVLGALRAAAGHRDVLLGFGALAAVLLLFTVLLPGGGKPLPQTDRPVLFYSEDCRHCTEIRREIEEQKMEALHLPVREYAATLRLLGIEEVPTLLVPGRYERSFLTGTDAIRRYLTACRQPPRGGARRSSVRPSANTAPAGSLPGALDLFPPAGAAGLLQEPPKGNGICREEQKCD